MNSATLPDRERVRLAALVGSIVRFKARNIAAAKWEHAFLRTLHLNRDGDWATLKYKSGEWTGDPSCWIIRPQATLTAPRMAFVHSATYTRREGIPPLMTRT